MADCEVADAPAKFKSRVWQYFGFENIIDKYGIRTLDKSKTVCKECRAQISYGTGNTTNMFTHLQRKHPHLYQEINANKTKPTQVSSSVKGVAPSGGQQTIKDAFQAKLNPNSPRALECTKSIGMFMAKDLRPFSVVDNPGFRYMVNTLEPRYKIPSRTHFAEKVVPQLYEEGCGSSRTVTEPSDKQSPAKPGQSHLLQKEQSVTKSKSEENETNLSGTKQETSSHKREDEGTYTEHTIGDGETHMGHTVDYGGTHTECTKDDVGTHTEHMIDDGGTHIEHTKEVGGTHIEHTKDDGGTRLEHTKDYGGTQTEHTKDETETLREQNEMVLGRTEQEDLLQEETSDTESLEREKKEIEESISKIMDSAKEIYEEIKQSEENDMLEEDSEVSMDDIGGLEDVKKELYEQIMLPVEQPEMFSKFGIHCSYILLHGPPGCGKKMLAKAIANEVQINFILHKVKPGKYVPYTDELREAFDQARSSVPCILFLDLNEFDTTARHGNSGADYIINQLLTELDGLGAGEKNKNLFVIGSVPSECGIDPSLLRPGRLSHMIHVPLPDEETRVKILEVTFRHTAEVQYTDLGYIAEHTKGFTGADLIEICNKAVRLAGGNTEDQDDDSCNSSTLCKISRNDLNEAYQTTKKSLTDEQIYYYEGLSKKKDNFRFGFPSPPKGEEKQGGYKVGQFNDDNDDDQLYGDSKTTSVNTRQLELFDDDDDDDDDLYS